MKVALAKPEYRVVGGFERVVEWLARTLSEEGHDIDRISVDVPSLGHDPFGVAVASEIWEDGKEFFRYAAMIEEFSLVNSRPYDLLISTQPPSFAVAHPRHLSIFFHHLRIYYDLSEVYLAAGFADPEVHWAAQRAVRELDAQLLAGVSFVLGPETVLGRLRAFNGLRDNLIPFNPGPGIAGDPNSPSEMFETPLCVSRHEFPKRTELFVHAMHLLPNVAGVMVGAGGRLPWVRHLDAVMTVDGASAEAQHSDALWLCPGSAPTETPVAGSRTQFRSSLSRWELEAEYARALCVVAPAYEEDYGLTALEAMSFAKPVVACRDGGGLTEFVVDGVTGFVVDPSGQGIAEAVRRFLEDPGLARKMGAAALEFSREYTWGRTRRELLDGLSRLGT